MNKKSSPVVGTVVRTFASHFDTSDRSVVCTIGVDPMSSSVGVSLWRLDSPHWPWPGRCVWRSRDEFTIVDEQ